jgi:hypothetical protein
MAEIMLEPMDLLKNIHMWMDALGNKIKNEADVSLFDIYSDIRGAKMELGKYLLATLEAQAEVDEERTQQTVIEDFSGPGASDE